MRAACVRGHHRIGRCNWAPAHSMRVSRLQRALSHPHALLCQDIKKMRQAELLVVLVLVSLIQYSEGHARTYTRCQLSRELLRYNFPRSLLPNWICLIEHASGRTTDKVTNHNNAYTSYGLFQINNKDWCKKGRKGGHCTMKCEDLINEDLADDVRCAKRIYDRVGFKAWPSSYAYCKEKSLPDLSRC